MRVIPVLCIISLHVILWLLLLSFISFVSALAKSFYKEKSFWSRTFSLSSLLMGLYMDHILQVHVLGNLKIILFLHLLFSIIFTLATFKKKKWNIQLIRKEFNILRRLGGSQVLPSASRLTAVWNSWEQNESSREPQLLGISFAFFLMPVLLFYI